MKIDRIGSRLVILGSLLASFSIVFVAAPALAGGTTRMGPYVGFNAAYGIDLFKDEAKKIVGPGTTVDNTAGLNARVGFRFLSAFALEGEYEWMKGFETRAPTIGGFDIESHVLTVNLRLMVPIWRVQPYLLAGMGGAWYTLDGVGPLFGGISVSTRAFAGRAGAGVDLYLTDHIVLNAAAAAVLSTADLEVTTTTLNSLHYLSISGGLQYRF